MEKTYFIETWGCQMNDLDSQRLSGSLKLRGYRKVESEREADLVILNTCSIRDKSEQKVYSRLGELRELKRERGTKIGVTGCVAQQEGESLIQRAPYVDFVLGTGNVGSLDHILEGERRVAVDFPEHREYDSLSIDRPSAVRAQITVIEGCNKNCTFCIVPTTRGREISRPLEQIVAEAQRETAAGRIEIELLGQTVNAYRCPITGADFATLLEAVANVEGVQRLRFITSHPAEVTDRMIAVMRDHENICRFLHLPVQSGSSAVLRRMKRLYTRERYLEIIGRIRAEIPDMLFSTDVIVGFPGETDEDFEQTLSLLREVRFGGIFAFKYSPRPGTPALRLRDHVDDAVASERLQRIFELQEQIEAETLASYVGRQIAVLYEGPSRHDPSVLSGKSDEKLTVNFKSPTDLRIGSIVPVRIEQALHHTLRGEAIV
jgi:tRNA-2-methylthio-N6-dimethylallyladenosine synthase